MFDSLNDTPSDFQQKLIGALNSIGETNGIDPVDVFNLVLCGNQDQNVKKKLYNWWRGFFDILSRCDIPSESKKEYDEKIDALISEITKAGSSIDGNSVEVVSEDYESASKEDEDKMLNDMKFAVSKIGEIANRVQDIINFVNPYCKKFNEEKERRRKFDTISERCGMNKNINENEGILIGDDEIDSPSEGGQYLIEPDIGENDKNVFAVYFKTYEEDEWEYQCTFDTRKEAEDWIDSEIEYAEKNNKGYEKYDEKSSNEWVSMDSLINEDEDDDEFEPDYHVGEHVIWDDPDGDATDGWVISNIQQTGDGIVYVINNQEDGSEAEVPEHEICLDDNYKVDEQFNESFLNTIANGFKGALKLLGKGLLVFIAGLGGSFLFGFPGLLLALALAFGIVSGEINESGKMIVNEGIFGKVKDKIKAVLKLLKTCSKEELKELNDRAKKNPQSVADDIKDLSEGKKDIDDLVGGDSLDESESRYMSDDDIHGQYEDWWISWFEYSSNGDYEEISMQLEYPNADGEDFDSGAVLWFKRRLDEDDDVMPRELNDPWMPGDVKSCVDDFAHELMNKYRNGSDIQREMEFSNCEEFHKFRESVVSESNDNEKSDDELKNASPKKFKNDNGSTSELVTGCSKKKQVSEMTIQQEIDDAEQLCEMLWGQGRSNLRELLDSKISSSEGIMSMISEMMGEEPPTLTEINDLLAYDFESVLELLGADMDRYKHTLDIVKIGDEDDSVELESVKK